MNGEGIWLREVLQHVRVIHGIECVGGERHTQQQVVRDELRVGREEIDVRPAVVDE
jgi:hypothetical protein